MHIGLAEVTGLLRDKGVVNLETLRAMAGEDVVRVCVCVCACVICV